MQIVLKNYCNDVVCGALLLHVARLATTLAEHRLAHRIAREGALRVRLREWYFSTCLIGKFQKNIKSYIFVDS